MSLFESASLVVTPNGTKASKLYAIKPTDGSGDLTVTRATTARRVNSSGLIESVASNVPRLDYTDSTCPSILVEGQRTNLAKYSDDFSNATWAKTRCTVTSNATTAPDGTLTADKLILSVDNNTHFIQQSGISVTAQIYSATVYAKKGEYDTVRLLLANLWTSPNPNAIFNLTTKSIVSTQNVTAKITELKDGWFKLDITATINAIAGGNAFFSIFGGNNGTVNLVGDGTSGIYIWGAQLEAGANATSYIPTTTASVTRNADVISKTGISSLIGQTEGTIFADVNIKRIGIPTRTFTNLTNTTANFINLSFLNTNVLRVTIRANAGTQYNVSTSALPIGRYKLAGTYKAGELKLYVNGVLIGTNTNASVSWSAALDRLNLDNSVLATDNFSDDINLVSHWKTVLTNEECINLTTL